MPKCIIDGREVEFTPGQNLVEVAKKAGIDIPVFCYHPGLSVVAQCRICAIEIEKMPKLQTACSTPATDGMVVKTNTERVKQNRKSVMEFLLLNHPLDCPICDKAGECTLQDYSYLYGEPYTRSTEERRTFMDRAMGTVIQKNMNRCIHCTRCIRFGSEIAGIREMVAIQRGNNTEITTVGENPLMTEYAGNYSDICPTGSLTLKDFRFKKRAWFLKKTATICEGCSRGCNMEIHEDSNIIYRCVARENMEVNKYWICDEGRFNYHYVHNEDRIMTPQISNQTNGAAGGLKACTWDEALHAAKAVLHNPNTQRATKVAVLIGSDMTQEEALHVQQFCRDHYMNNAVIRHYGTPGIRSSADDAPADQILKRKSKTANLHGLEKLGIPGLEAMPFDVDAVIVVNGGRATLPTTFHKNVSILGIGVFTKAQAKSFAAVLPGFTFAEKDGTVVNFDGREQRFKRAIFASGQCRLLSDILIQLSGAKPAPHGKTGSSK